MRPLHQPSVQRWLQDHCESSAHVAGGLVVLAGAGLSQPQTVAEWPASGGMTAPLSAAAHAAVERSRPVVVAPTVALPDSKHNRVISLPLRQGERTLGAVALAIQADSTAQVEALFKELTLASANVGQSLGGSVGNAASGEGDAARVLQLQDTLLRHSTLQEGALAMVSELAQMLGCDRVSIGVAQPHKPLEVLAVSDSAEFKAEQELLRLMAAAMQEAVDQSARVVFPALTADPPQVVLAHAELHTRSGMTLASVALAQAQEPTGALLAEWRSTAPPSPEQLALLDSLGCVLGPLLGLSRRAERTWRARSAQALRQAAERMTQRNDPLPKVLAVLLLLAAGAALWLPVTYRLAAPAHIEGAVQRVLAAPIDGFLQKSHVRPGDTVRAGDVLVELADQDLLLEQRKWQGVLSQHENGFAAALARADRSQFVITQGKAGEAQAQLDLVRQQLARTKLLAPIDGVVIKGDLSQTLGAPVQRGEALLTLAPAERYRLMLDVDERDVAAVQPGQKGQLALASLPGEALAFVVERVTPVANVREGRNTFEVQARLLDPASVLRPGLQGVAKIEAGQQPAAWIWSHRGLDWLRLAWWSWGP
jgi:multidrug resistance efflux pump